MSPMAVLRHGSLLFPPTTIPRSFNRRSTKDLVEGCVHRGFLKGNTCTSVSVHFKPSRFSYRIRCIQHADAEGYEPDRPTDSNAEQRYADEVLGNQKNRNIDTGNLFLAKLAFALGIAVTVTVISIGFKPHTPGSLPGFQILADSSSSSAMAASPVGFTFKAFGYSIVLPEYTPGWVYFWLLMAAGCGLFISEEALNVWVGVSLARMLSLDGTWHSLASSFSKNAPYIISTVLWVYWGVCISDMVPFYLGKLFRQSGASDDVCVKLGIDKKKAVSITNAVQRYGNLIGFVERFSLGVRNPTAFLAGSLGISPECFFAGVCCGGLVTLPLQLWIGFLLRERPVFTLATVATAVGIWTVLPYAAAASTALFLFLRRQNT